MSKTIKWILVAVVLVVIGNIAKEALKANKEVDARVSMKGACVRQAQSGGAVPTDKTEIACSCTVDRTARLLGRTRLIRLAEVKNATDADKQAFIESLAACMAEHAPPR